MNPAQRPEQLEGVAVIGLAGCFPGAADIDHYWKNLSDGVESVMTFSDQQLLSAGVRPDLIANPNYVKAGILLDGIDLFDAGFFGFTPREAALTDPQHRIFLECAWEALENAGYDADRCPSRTGVYAGAGINNYLIFNLASHPDVLLSLTDLQRMIATDKDYLATRVSYKLGLKGPSITIQTACSTSLVATHLACQSLLSGECDMALAGGVALRIPQMAGYVYEEGAIASPDGHCRAFDAAARGTVSGSGAGIVVLKRLEDAIEAGDFIHAVIRGSAINNDGAAKIGYTAPSVDGQTSVIAEAQALAGVDPEEVTYVETHGTGTTLGDPIEIAGLTQAFRRATQKKQFCAIGSVKANIGHLDAAAGVASLIKVVMALENRTLPPSINFENPNPAIDFANSPFYVQKTRSEWQPLKGRRVAGISSFGIGGTNTHVVVEEAPSVDLSGKLRPWQLLPISAKTPAALEKATENLADFLGRHPQTNLGDVAFTLQTGRKVFAHRRTLAVKDIDEAIQLLKSRDSVRVATGFLEHASTPVDFMFPGQGAQYVNMALEIYRTEGGFRDVVDFCCEYLRPHLGLDLRSVLYPPPEKSTESGEELNHTAITQPALFVIEYATARLWTEWGVSPESMIGHSIGEYVAATLAGVFQVEDALALVAARGRLMESMPEGSMLAVRMGEEQVCQYLEEGLSLAAVNGQASCVVAGPSAPIEALSRTLGEKGIDCRILRTSHAFHSPMMDAVVDPFQKLFAKIKLRAPKIPFISNVTGTWIDPAQAMDPGYWASHLRQAVRFADGISELLKKQDRVLLEVGPGQTLARLARQHPAKSPRQTVLSSFGYTKSSVAEPAEVFMTLGRLWTAGSRIDWSALHSGQKRRRVPLPTYPFERRRYWIEPAAVAAAVDSLGETELKIPVASRASPGAAHCGYSEGGYERPDLANAYVAPQGGSEEALASIWQRLLGVEKVGRDDDYFELGGDSLLAVRLFAEIEKQFRKKLPLSTLFEAPLLKQQASLVGNLPRPVDWPSLVTIQAHGSKPPLFLVHGAEGNVLLYRQLAHYLGLDQPVYGLQSQGLSGNGHMHSTIEEMAAQYVDEVKSVQPHGPYYLGGYCLGGTVSLEMAQRLKAQGERTDLVVMIDTYNLGQVPESQMRRLKFLHLLQNIWFHALNFGSIRTGERSKFLREKWSVAKARVRIRCLASFDELKRWGNPGRPREYPHLLITRTNDQAMIRYVPKPYLGRVAVIRPKGHFWALDDPTLGWSEVVGNGLDVRQIPALPKGMMVEPFVRMLAEEVKDCLRDVQHSRVNRDECDLNRPEVPETSHFIT